jgi:sec-independent protein translocase protein TatA
MFLKGFEGWHILIIVGLLVVLFGARKLPDSARSIGQSLRIFKSEMKAAGQDEDSRPPAALEQDAAPPAANPHAGTGTGAAAPAAGQDTAEFDNVRR